MCQPWIYHRQTKAIWIQKPSWLFQWWEKYWIKIAVQFWESGQSRHNESIFGWSGHDTTGSKLSNRSGSRGYIQCWKKAFVSDVFENVASFTRLSSVLEGLSIKDKNYFRKEISIDNISFMLREKDNLSIKL